MALKAAFFALLLFATSGFTGAKYKDVSDRPKCASSDPKNTFPSTDKLAKLRDLMKTSGLDGYVVPAVDQHGSEYIGEPDKRRQWLTSFTGSAGEALITADKAILWTDGRYLLQAETELDCNWGILEMAPTIADWMAEHLDDGAKIGADPSIFTQKSWKKIETKLAGNESAALTLKPVDSLIDRIWKVPERPARPNGADISVQPLKFAGVSWEEKVTHARALMSAVEADYLLVVDLMEVAWLLNLRGVADIPFNPVFYGFALVPKNDASPIRLFVGSSRITEELKKHLRPDCEGQSFRYYVEDSSAAGREIKAQFCPDKSVVVEEYDRFYEALGKLVGEKDTTKFWFSSYANYKIFQMIPEKRQILDPPSPLRDLKAVKNPTERDGMKSAHVKDAVALVKFAAELERVVLAGAETWTEVRVADRLKQLREAETDNRGVSFPTIAGFDANGAIIHYNPRTNDHPAEIKKSGMLLLDSGGQYLDGTTDVTRTFHYGQPTEYQKESYTRVLMGQVDLALAIFPELVVTGNDLQVLARAPLWRRGMEYHHGTGHGIGSFLSVHEPPRLSGEKMKAGLFFSDEPGYYVPNQFGIRLENICFTKVVDLPYAEEDQKFLSIESITLVPYEPKLIQIDLLDNRQRKWINEYHAQCENVIGRELKRRGETEAYDWLMARTKPLPLLVGSSAERWSASLALIAVSVLTTASSLF